MTITNSSSEEARRHQAGSRRFGGRRPECRFDLLGAVNSRADLWRLGNGHKSCAAHCHSYSTAILPLSGLGCRDTALTLSPTFGFVRCGFNQGETTGLRTVVDNGMR
jgi:hypothetical protein